MRTLRSADRRGLEVAGPERGVDYETFEHQADIGVRGFGSTVEEAYANAAAAMYSVMVEIGRVEQRESRDVRVTADDPEQLLVEWLNALLAISDIERMVFCRFLTRIQGQTLTGTAWGEHLDQLKHEPKVEVKGATYHLVKVAGSGGRYVAQCVVDV